MKTIASVKDENKQASLPVSKDYSKKTSQSSRTDEPSIELVRWSDQSEKKSVTLKFEKGGDLINLIERINEEDDTSTKSASSTDSSKERRNIGETKDSEEIEKKEAMTKLLTKSDGKMSKMKKEKKRFCKAAYQNGPKLNQLPSPDF